MKKILYLLLVFVLVAPMLSCKDYLDVEHFSKDKQSLEKVFTNRDYTLQWLAGVYSTLAKENADVSSKAFMPFNLLSDDMFYGDNGRDGSNSYKMYKNGEYNENNVYQHTWGMCYEGIRNASIYIDNVDKNKMMREGELKDTKAQARFVRAYLYWLLLRKYGPIPILPIHGMDYTLPYPELALPRNSYDECVKFISDELVMAAIDLPTIRERNNRTIGMATRGAALGTRAKMLIFAASPLFNGGKPGGPGNTDMAELVDNKGRQLIPQTIDNRKWAVAAAAARDLIETGDYSLYYAPFREEAQSPYQPATIVPPYNPVYSDANFPEGWKNIDPYESYRQLFNGDRTAFGNPELIFSRVQEQYEENIAQMVWAQFPFSLGGGSNHGATQKQVDAYYMKDGSSLDLSVDIAARPRPTGFTENNTDHLPLPANVAMEYANREPRFYASIAYNGSIWECASDPRVEYTYNQVFYYRGKPDGFFPDRADRSVRTGIGVKKYYNPLDTWKPSNNLGGGRIMFKPEPAMRYAEMLLIYAEALNEVEGSYQIPNYRGDEVYTITREVSRMSKAVSQVRVRGGVPDYDVATYSDQAKLRTAIKRERQIELFAETHRYYDLRRWMDAEIEESAPVYGCNMTMSGSDAERVQFHTPIEIPSLPSVFIKRMYLWPMSHGVLKRNRNLTQNPGWTYFD